MDRASHDIMVSICAEHGEDPARYLRAVTSFVRSVVKLTATLRSIQGDFRAMTWQLACMSRFGAQRLRMAQVRHRRRELNRMATHYVAKRPRRVRVNGRLPKLRAR